MTDEFDEFAGGSGLKDNYDAMIVDAYFTTDPGYNGGNTLILKLKKQDLADGSEHEDFYPCGADWASYDGGDTAEHPRGDKHPFNNNSGVQGLVKAAFASGAERAMRERSRASGGRGARSAAIWKGLTFHWDAVEETFRLKDRTAGSPTEGQMVERTTTRIMPTRFLGHGGPVDANTARSAPSSETTASSAAPTPNAQPLSANAQPETTNGTSNPLELVPVETAAKMRVMAGSLDHHAWIDFCMDLPGVIDAGNVLLTAIGDEAFYNTLKG